MFNDFFNAIVCVICFICTLVTGEKLIMDQPFLNINPHMLHYLATRNNIPPVRNLLFIHPFSLRNRRNTCVPCLSRTQLIHRV